MESLNVLSPGDVGYVKEIKTVGAMRRRLMDIGLIENTRVECVGKSPSGDPKAFLIRGTVVAIRNEDCKNIIIDKAV